MKNNTHNFSAGPAIIPADVLEEVKNEFLNFNKIGSSIIEISHRDKIFVDIAEKAAASARRLLNVPDEYKIIFLQGGATLQFSMIPMNFATKLVPAYADVGSWSSKAIKEATKICEVKVCTSAKKNNYTSIKDISDWSIASDSAYVHYCKNETIQGIRINSDPNFNVPSFVDMSSCIFSESLDISKYDFIYACAQKNFGAAGITLIIIKDDLLEKSNQALPNMLNYKSHFEQSSMLNTPNTFGWYLAGKIFDWYERSGGISEMEKLSIQKSSLLYNIIDSSDFYLNPVNPKQRSRCNVVFTLLDEKLEKKFVDDADSEGLKYLKGHRSVGGMRASIYNAMKLSSVEALASFMEEFEKKYG